MINYAEYIKIGRLLIVTWMLPGMEDFFCREEGLKHLFGLFYFKY